MPGRPFEESTMNGDRALTIHFLDGTHVSFGFPAQKANDAARSMMLDEVLEKPYLLIEADGALIMYPMTAIKSIQLSDLSGQNLAMPGKGIVRGASVIN
jgi:hypothetical protein